MSMTLCMPKSWFKQMEILSSLSPTGGKELENTFKDVKFIRPVEEVKVEPRKKEEVKVESKKEEVKEASILEFVVDEVNTKMKEEDIDINDKEVQQAVKEAVKVEATEPEIIVDVPAEEIKPVEEEPTATLKPVDPVADDNITMATRTTRPVVKVVPKKKKVKIQVGTTPKVEEIKSEEFDESLETLKMKLVEKSINITSINRMPTKLIEVGILNKFNQPVLLTVDNDNILYGLGTDVFFIGRVNVFDEYKLQPFLLTDNSLNAVLNNTPIDNKYYVPENVLLLSRLLDVASVHEHDTKKKEAVFEKAAKALLEVEQDIKETMGAEPYRFSFAKYKAPDDFVLISGNKSRLSNLIDEKLKATKTIRLSVNKKNVNLNIK